MHNYTTSFMPCNSITEVPSPILGVLSVVMIGDAYVIVKKKNNEWYTPGGKISLGESIYDATDREVYEKSGVKVDTKESFIIGYIKCDNVDYIENNNFHQTNYMPVFLSFAYKVDRNWLPNECEILDRINDAD